MDPLLLFPQTGRLGVRVPTNGLREAPRPVSGRAGWRFTLPRSAHPSPPRRPGPGRGPGTRGAWGPLDPRTTEKVRTFLTPAPQAPHLPQPSRLPAPPRSETPGFLTG